MSAGVPKSIAVCSILLLGLCAGATAAPGDSGDGDGRPSAEGLREALDRVYGEEDYQTEIGVETLPDPEGLPAWVARLVVWAILLGALGVLLFALASGLLFAVTRLRRGERDGASSTPAGRKEAEQKARQALGEAEIMASGRKYLDALRTLFLEAASRIQDSRKIALAPADTNLEYLARFPEAWNVRAVMERLAALVDRCYYGGHDCTEEDWIASRDAWTKALEIDD